jgi:hypothetical protein
MPEAGHILYLRILYPIHIQAPKKDIISYHYHVKKSIWIYILYPLSKILPAMSQFLNNKKPDLVKSSTFYRIELKFKTLIYQQRSKEIANHSRNGINGSAKRKILPLKPKISGTKRWKKDIGWDMDMIFWNPLK